MSQAVVKQTEAQFQAAVKELAERLGWKVAHFNDSRREVVDRRTGQRRLVGDNDAKGFPDLVLARNGRVVIVELKAEKGRLKREQRDWLQALGVDENGEMPVQRLFAASLSGTPPNPYVACWRPSDWPEIERVLR